MKRQAKALLLLLAFPIWAVMTLFIALYLWAVDMIAEYEAQG